MLFISTLSDISHLPFFFDAFEEEPCKIHFVAVFFLQFTHPWKDAVLSEANLFIKNIVIGIAFILLPV